MNTAPRSGQMLSGVEVAALDLNKLTVRYFPVSGIEAAYDLEAQLGAEYAKSWVEDSAPNAVRHATGAARAQVGISKASPQDLEAIAKIDRSEWGAWANPLPLYRQLLDIFPSAILVARDLQGKPVGAAVALVCENRKEGWILSVDIDANHRGLGIARALLTSALEDLRAKGCSSVSAMIAPENRASLALFQSFGFSPEAYDPNYFGSGVDQIKVQLRLATGSVTPVAA